MITVVAAIIRRHGRILICRRMNHVHLPGLWEFPGGKVEGGESLKAALKREILEELDVDVDVLDECLCIQHRYPEKAVELHFFDCAITNGEPRAADVAELRWVEPRELRAFRFPEADSELIAHLESV